MKSEKKKNGKNLYLEKYKRNQTKEKRQRFKSPFDKKKKKASSRRQMK